MKKSNPFLLDLSGLSSESSYSVAELLAEKYSVSRTAENTRSGSNRGKLDGKTHFEPRDRFNFWTHVQMTKRINI